MLAAFVMINVGWLAYYAFLYDWFYPNDPNGDKWNLGGFAMLGLILAIGLTAVAVVSWKLAQSIVRPIKSVANVVHSIAAGDFAERRGFDPPNQRLSMTSNFMAVTTSMSFLSGAIKSRQSQAQLDQHQATDPVTGQTKPSGCRDNHRRCRSVIASAKAVKPAKRKIPHFENDSILHPLLRTIWICDLS